MTKIRTEREDGLSSLLFSLRIVYLISIFFQSSFVVLPALPFSVYVHHTISYRSLSLHRPLALLPFPGPVRLPRSQPTFRGQSGRSNRHRDTDSRNVLPSLAPLNCSILSVVCHSTHPLLFSSFSLSISLSSSSYSFSLTLTYTLAFTSLYPSLLPPSFHNPLISTPLLFIPLLHSLPNQPTTKLPQQQQQSIGADNVCPGFGT